VAAETLMEAVEGVMGRGIKTRDLGGSSGTVEVTDAVCKEIETLGPRKRTMKQEINGNAHIEKQVPL